MVKNCRWCGLVFEARHYNQEYCSLECKDKSRNDRRKKKPKKVICVKSDTPTIHDMVHIAMQLSKERGEPLQYGDVQKEIRTGKLKVKGGVIIK